MMNGLILQPTWYVTSISLPDFPKSVIQPLVELSYDGAMVSYSLGTSVSVTKVSLIILFTQNRS